MWIGTLSSWSPVRPTILVVEDELLVRMCAASCLMQAGFDVIEAADGDEARCAFEARGDIALLFTDVDMPGSLDGLSLAREIRRRRPGLPVIVTTGKVTPREDQMPSGGRFLAKPYVPEVLPKIVAQALTCWPGLPPPAEVAVDAPAGDIYSDK
jgi:CheY-like chemotaxis protein